MSLILEVLGILFVDVLQAIVGILYPVKSENLKRAQRWAAMLLLAAVAMIAAAVALAVAGVSVKTVLVCLLTGVVSAIVAGVIGHRIEKSCRSGPDGEAKQ